jgi:hypothetical protein
MRTALAAIFLFLLSFHAASADTALDLVAAGERDRLDGARQRLCFENKWHDWREFIR